MEEPKPIEPQTIDPEAKVIADPKPSDNGTELNGITREEAIEKLKILQQEKSFVDSESKKRKEKLRELESQKAKDEQDALLKQSKFQEALEKKTEETKDFEKNRIALEEFESEVSTEVQELEAKLTVDQKKTYDLISSKLSARERRQYLKATSVSVTPVNIDTTMSGRGDVNNIPDNREDMKALSAEKQKEIMVKYPEKFDAAIRTRKKINL